MISNAEVSLIIKDLKLQKMRDLGKKKLRVGVVGSEAQNEVDGEGITMARLAGVHEYGAVIKTRYGILKIPERSFIRSTIKAKNNYRNTIIKLIEMFIEGKVGEEKALSFLGEKIVGDIKQRISNGEIKPENAPSTIARKRSSKPLVDTGRLVGSITYVVEEDS